MINKRNLFTFIEVSGKQRFSPSSAFIRLLSCNIKGRIEKAVLREDTLRVKRIIVV